MHGGACSALARVSLWACVRACVCGRACGRTVYGITVRWPVGLSVSFLQFHFFSLSFPNCTRIGRGCRSQFDGQAWTVVANRVSVRVMVRVVSQSVHTLGCGSWVCTVATGSTTVSPTWVRVRVVSQSVSQ